MKFRTKLIITFLIVILLPILLSGIAFIAVGAMVSYNSDLNFQIEISDESTLSDSLASLSNTTNMMYIRLENIAHSVEVKRMLSNLIEKEREEKKVVGRDMYGAAGHLDDVDYEDIDHTDL